MPSPRLKKSTMPHLSKLRAAAAAGLSGALLGALAFAAVPAVAAGPLEPPGKKVYFGVSDTGDPASFGQFSSAVSHHPPVIESFRTWGSDFPESIRRWQTARARPMIHITTADSNDGHELISPRAIALGGGDEYLARLNKLFYAKKMRAYVRPLGEPNRCLNVYSSYECAGHLRDAAHRPRWYKLAFRRIYVIVHGGGKAAKINQRLAEAHLPPLTIDVRGLPAAPVAVIWSPLPAGSPTAPQNRPRHFYPGSRWVDWAGTDFYASYPEWKALSGLYKRFTKAGKPFVITEWGVENGDDPAFVSRLFTWVKRHPRCRMLVYYQDFGSTSAYRIQNYSASLEVLRSRLHSPLFPSFARGAPACRRRPPAASPRGARVGSRRGAAIRRFTRFSNRIFRDDRQRRGSMSALRRITASPHLAALAGIVVLGAGLRFSTLGLQSYRYDEAVTVGRVLHPSLFATLSEVPHSESTPPLYYLVAWAWSRPFGTGEVWLRSLSALAGTGSILAVYLSAPALALPRRAGLIAAAAVAVSPVLIWFSQDARAYSLVFLLTALSFLFFARARGGGRRDLAWWAAFSALAIATHYFAGFVVAAEAALLLLGRDRRGAAVATLAVLAVAAALTPIALRQADNAHAGWIAEQPLGQRLERTGAKLVGNDNGDEHGSRRPGPIPLAVPAALAIAALALALWRGDPDERRGAGVAALVAALALLAPLGLAALGADYFDGRNLLPAFVPLLIVLGAGFGARRAGRVGLGLAAAFCLCSLVFTLEIDRLPRLQREDLRNAAAAVGPLRPDTAVVTSRYSAGQPLRYYLGAGFATAALPPLREIDLIGSAGAADRNAGRLLPPSFHRVGAEPVSYDFTLTRFRSRRPVRVPLRLLERGALVGGGRRAAVLVSPPPAPAGGSAAGR